MCRGKAFFVLLVLIIPCVLQGHLYMAHFLTSQDGKQRLFLYGDYHYEVSAKVTAIETAQLVALLGSCKSYEKAPDKLLLLAEDSVRAHGGSVRLSDQRYGFLSGLLNELDDCAIHGLNTTNIELRKVLFSALFLFEYTQFPMSGVGARADIGNRLYVLSCTYRDLLDEIEERFGAVVEKYESLHLSCHSADQLVAEASKALNALYSKVMYGVDETTSLLRYAMDLANQDAEPCPVSSHGFAWNRILQKESTLLIDDYAAIAPDDYYTRLKRLVWVWDKVTNQGELVGERRKAVFDVLVPVGSAMVELEALCTIVQAQRERSTIAVFAGGDHIRSLVALLQDCGFKETWQKELVYNQALDPSIVMKFAYSTT